MWLDKDNNEDPYNRGDVAGKTVNTPSIGSGAGGGAPVGAGEGNQTNSTPSTNNPVQPVPQQKEATVQDYLGANKAQGNQLGQQFQTNLQGVKNKDTGTIDSSANNVKSQAAAGTTAYDPNVVNKAYNDPTKVANDPGQLQSFLKQWNAAYTGPANFEGTTDYDTANKAATDAQTHGTEVGDAGGRKQILQDDYGVYGQGNKGLDQTLLQNSDNFGQVLDTGKQLSTIPDYLKAKATDVNAATTKAAADTAATSTNTQNLFKNSLNDFQSGLNSKVQGDMTTANALAAQTKADLASGDQKKIVADMGKAGADPNGILNELRDLNTTYGVKPDVSNYYTYNPTTAINPATAASKDDFAKAAALQKLTGTDYSAVLNPADAAKAGTWAGNSGNFNTKDLNSYIKTQLAQQDKELLSKNNWSDFAAKANTINVLDPKNFANAAGYQDVYNKILSAAQRSNTPRTDPNLQSLLTQAAQAFTLQANHGDSQGMHGTDPNNPAIAGLRKFVNDLGTYIYGNRYSKY